MPRGGPKGGGGHRRYDTNRVGSHTQRLRDGGTPFAGQHLHFCGASAGKRNRAQNMIKQTTRENEGERKGDGDIPSLTHVLDTNNWIKKLSDEKLSDTTTKESQTTKRCLPRTAGNCRSTGQPHVTTGRQIDHRQLPAGAGTHDAQAPGPGERGTADARTGGAKSRTRVKGVREDTQREGGSRAGLRVRGGRAGGSGAARRSTKRSAHARTGYAHVQPCAAVGGRFRTAQAQCQISRCSSRAHPCTPPPYRRMHDPFNTASAVRNSGPWDPWQASD